MKHLHSKRGDWSPTYYTWAGMKQRCRRAPGYAHVSICKRWGTFENFLADMGERPEGTTLDRRDTLGDYNPSNCQWATLNTQARNRINSKLTEGCIARIRDLLRMGVSGVQIAKHFAVSKTMIYHIKHGRQWA